MQKFRGRVDSHKVQVVDTTGAGDAFCAGVLIQLGKDISILEARRLPNLFFVDGLLCFFTNIFDFDAAEDPQTILQRAKVDTGLNRLEKVHFLHGILCLEIVVPYVVRLTLVTGFSDLQNEGKLREALRFANACGAITTTERGAIPSLPDMDTVMRFISKVPA
jgi:sugar/nucleoside kinase (ribokinase family)